MSFWGYLILAHEIYDDDDDGKKYDEEDAANDTGVTLKQAIHHWHTARDDAEEDGEITRSRNR